jgi:hypothetical protein
MDRHIQLAKEKANEDKRREKQMAIDRKKAEAELFKTALVQPKVPFGVDPKTIMCVFFKAGVCEKGKSRSDVSAVAHGWTGDLICNFNRNSM